MRKRVTGIIVAMVLGLGGAIAIASPAAADTIGPFAIQDLMNPSKCIDTNSQSDGARPFIKYCDYGVTQNWFFDRVPGTSGSSSLFEIRSTWGPDYGVNMCLDVTAWNPNQFAPIQMWDCNHTYNQQFSLSTTSSGYFQIHNWSGWCLTVEGTYPYDYTNLFMNSCSPELGRNTWQLL